MKYVGKFKLGKARYKTKTRRLKTKGQYHDKKIEKRYGKIEKTKHILIVGSVRSPKKGKET